MKPIDHLALCAIKDIKAPMLERLTNISPQALYKLPTAACRHFGLKEGSFADKFRALDWSTIEQWRHWQTLSPHHHLITWFDEQYPPRLKHLPDPPTLLFAIGNRDLLRQQTMGIVGSRKPSAYGKDNAAFFAHWLVQYGWVIISGFARGIDGVAHTATLRAEGSTIAVLGCGVNYPYPKQHQTMKQQIIETGLIISEYGLTTAPHAYQFPRRNRIIAALSQGIIVAEASMQSGSLITAKLALDLGREVYAIPGSIRNPLTKGTHYLIKNGAKLIESLTDIHQELSADKRPDDMTKLNTVKLEPQAHLILESLGYEPMTADQLVEHTGLTAHQINQYLIELTMKGLIDSVPGGYRRAVQ